MIAAVAGCDINVAETEPLFQHALLIRVLTGSPLAQPWVSSASDYTTLPLDAEWNTKESGHGAPEIRVHCN